jgi:hypothetical protein
MTFSRTHIYLPALTPTGDLLAYADVTFVDSVTGVLTTSALYRTNNPSDIPLHNPVTFLPSIIDIWCDDPTRFDLVITGPHGYSNTIRGVDFMPAPAEVTRAAVYNEFTTPPLTGRVLLSNGTIQYWDYLNLVAPHNHDGAMAGSTRLDLGDGAADTSIDQTWVGDAAGGSATDASNSSAVGADADPSAKQVTLLGQGTLATTVGVPGDRSVAVGRAAFAAADSVSVGSASGQSVLATTSLPLNSSVVLDVYVNPTSVGLRNAFTSATASEIGNAIAKPAVPGGVTNPLWLRGDASIPGRLLSSANAQLGGAANILACFGQAGATKATIPTGATGALASLLTALRAYGLIV